MRRYITRLLLVALIFSQAISLFGDTALVYANADEDTTTSSGREQIRPERGDSNEYYYYDGNAVYGKAGQYSKDVKFVFDEDVDGGVSAFKVEGNAMDVNPSITQMHSETCKTGSVPTKLWDKTQSKASDRPAIFLNITPSSGVELDLKDDQEDGMFRWGKIKEEIVASLDSIPSDISGATLAKDHLVFSGNTLNAAAAGIDGAIIGGGFPVHIQDSDLQCNLPYYNHFNRLIAPYDDTTTALAPLAGHILGIRGMAFDEYVVRADNRLLYYAYMQAAREQTTDHCNVVANSQSCINDVDTAVQRCYADAAGSSGIFKPLGNLKEQAEWDTPLDEEKFVSCLEGKNELVDKGYFRNAGHLQAFVDRIVSSVIQPPSLQPMDVDPIATTSEGAPAPDDTECSLGMLGWILCPAFNFIASMNDKIFSILINWLVLAPFQQNPGGPNSAAYSTWQHARNIVNVLFIVFFIVAIYAQVTGRGLQTYGIRALAPRIIVGALLVNLSYVICGVAVDISNIMGDSIYRILNDNTSVQGAAIGSGAFDGGWQNVTASITLLGGAAAGTVVLLGNLAALVPIMIMAFVALVTAFLMLLFRQALIIIFVAFAPFAFILFVLPNTKSYFDKWRTIFTQLLLLYPAFALIFSGSQIAAQVVRDTAAQSGQEILMIFSLGIQVIPLFLLPLLMKVGGGVLNRFGGIVNNPNKGLFDRAKNRAEEFKKDQKTQQQSRALNGRTGALGYGALIRSDQRRQQKYGQHKRNAARAQQRYLAGQQKKIGSLAAGRLAGKELKDQMLDHIQGNVLKEALEEYEAANTLIQHNIEDYDDSKLQQMATRQGEYGSISDSEQAAAIDAVFQSGNIEAVEEMLGQLYAQSSEFTQLQKHIILKAAQSSGIGDSAAHLSAQNLQRTLSPSDPTASGPRPAGQEEFVNSLYANADKNGAFTASTMATQDEATYKGISRAIAAGAIDSTKGDAIKANYRLAASDSKLSTVMTASTREAGRNHL